MLGAIFGIARGLLIVLLAVMLGGLTPLPKEPWWKHAVFAPPLETAVLAARPWLPAGMAQKIRYR
jgi:membrane protein required for colicin V production